MDGHNDSILEYWYSCASAIEFAKLPWAGNINSHIHTHTHTRMQSKLINCPDTPFGSSTTHHNHIPITHNQSESQFSQF